MDILIDSEIGYGGVTADSLRSQLAKVKDGDDVRIVVNSPGGDCFEGIAAYNVIREFARSRRGAVNTYIQGMAASAASWIALAASSVSPENKVIIEDNSVFMVHDCWGAVVGNKHDMRDAADFAERVDGLMCAMLAKKSGKSEEEISALMDAETWYFGQEIIDAGFADEVAPEKKKEEEEESVETGNPDEESPEKTSENPEEEEEKKKKDALALARKRLSDAQMKIQDNAREMTRLVKDAAAMVREQSEAERARREKAEIEKSVRDRLSRAREIYSKAI